MKLNHDTLASLHNRSSFKTLMKFTERHQPALLLSTVLIVKHLRLCMGFACIGTTPFKNVKISLPSLRFSFECFIGHNIRLKINFVFTNCDYVEMGTRMVWLPWPWHWPELSSLRPALTYLEVVVPLEVSADLVTLGVILVLDFTDGRGQLVLPEFPVLLGRVSVRQVRQFFHFLTDWRRTLLVVLTTGHINDGL